MKAALEWAEESVTSSCTSGGKPRASYGVDGETVARELGVSDRTFKETVVEVKRNLAFFRYVYRLAVEFIQASSAVSVSCRGDDVGAHSLVGLDNPCSSAAVTSLVSKLPCSQDIPRFEFL